MPLFLLSAVRMTLTASACYRILFAWHGVFLRMVEKLERDGKSLRAHSSVAKQIIGGHAYAGPGRMMEFALHIHTLFQNTARLLACFQAFWLSHMKSSTTVHRYCRGRRGVHRQTWNLDASEAIFVTYRIIGQLS